jgi:hypothetical protein
MSARLLNHDRSPPASAKDACLRSGTAFAP